MPSRSDRVREEDSSEDWNDLERAFAREPSPAPGPRIWSVGELTREIKSALEDFGRVHLAISEPNGTISVIPMQEG